MNRIIYGLCVMAAGLFIGTAEVHAGPLDNVGVIKGMVQVQKNSDGTVSAITIKTTNGESVHVLLNKTGNEIARIDGYGIFATGSYDDHGDFMVATWFMRREYERQAKK